MRNNVTGRNVCEGPLRQKGALGKIRREKWSGRDRILCYRMLLHASALAVRRSCSADQRYMGLGKTNDCLWWRDNTLDLDVPSDDFHSDMPVETCFCMNESGTARAWAFAALPLAGYNDTCISTGLLPPHPDPAPGPRRRAVSPRMV